MLQSSESDFSSAPNVRLIQQAMNALKQSVSAHLEYETRLEQMYLGWQKRCLSQFDQLRTQIEVLEARISPWIRETDNAPRLAVVSHHEDLG